MRVLWFVAGLLPEACEKLGYLAGIGCGWLQAMLDALRKVRPGMRMCVASVDSRPCDIEIDGVRHVSFGVTGGFTYRKVPAAIEARAVEIVQMFNPDVIHVQGAEYFFGRMTEEVYCGKPVVVSLQGILSECWTHFSGGITPREMLCDNLLNPRVLLRGRTIFQEQAWWRDERARQEREVFRRRWFFIGRTAWDRGWVMRCHPNAVYFHVDEILRPPFYTVRRERVKVRPHTVYCAGAAAYPLKGAHWLFRAVAALKETFPDIQLRIANAERIMARPKGLNEWLHRQVYHDYLRRLAWKLGIERNIVALPGLDADDVARELARAELYVSASLCENSPNSLGEAMMVGTPAIQTRVGGVSSVLKDGVEGRLVPCCDPAALADAIRDGFLDPASAESRAEAARWTASERHDARRNAEATLNVYGRILDQSCGSSVKQ